MWKPPLAVVAGFCSRRQNSSRLAGSRIRDNDPIRLRVGMDGGPGEALDDAVELEAAIEAVGEAGEVGLRMLRADVVVGTSERGLDVAQAGIDPLERRPARGPLAGTGRHREVLAAGLLDRRPAGQAVADDITPGSEVSFGQPFHLLLAGALDHAQPQPPRPTMAVGLDRGDDCRLAGGTAAALAARALAAPIARISLCLISHAVCRLTPSLRPSSSELIPFLPWARW